MGTQLKHSFKKEMLQFLRTFRFAGVLIAIFAFAIADPLMYKLLDVMMKMLNDMETLEPASEALMALGAASMSAEIEMTTDLLSVFDAPLIFMGAMGDICSSAVLVVMLILMSPAGGEQKKRATVIPLTSGLDGFAYVIPKFVIYPLTAFAAGTLASLATGGIANALFPNPVEMDKLVPAAFFAGVYIMFAVSVYLCVGLATSRPGISTIIVFFGTTIVQLILQSLDISGYNPLTLRMLATGSIFSEFETTKQVTSAVVGVVISVVVSVLMCVLAGFAVKIKKVNNRDDAPEF